MSELKVGDWVQVTGIVHNSVDPQWVVLKVRGSLVGFHPSDCEKIEQPKCGKMLQPSQTTVIRCSLEPGHVGACCAWWSEPCEDRRKPSTDPRAVALDALEKVGGYVLATNALRRELRATRSNYDIGRDPLAPPRRKEDRRG